MALKTITRIPRNIQRVVEILRALWHHGLGHFVARLNVQEHLPVVARIVNRGKVELPPADDETIAHRLMLVMQELGPTFIKLGQLLSVRPDFVPEPYLSEFRKLQDKVKPFPTADAKVILRKELGKELADIFSEFPEEPVASGSIAQVYATTLRDGTPVMIKVRRPDIEAKIENDIDILRFLARHAERSWPEISPSRIVDEFENAIRKELDFVVEASYTSKFHQFLAKVPKMRSPQVYWDYTTSKVLTMERLHGVRPDDIAELDRRGINRSELARTLGQIFIKQYVDLGLFHADPHPGNIFIGDDGTVALVDFGMTGHLTDEQLSQLSTALIAISNQQIEMLMDIYVEMGESPTFEPRQMKPDLLELFDKYYGMPLKRIDAGHVFHDALRIARKHGLVLPRDLVMLMRSLMIITSVGRGLDPDFNMAELLEPEARRLLLRKLSPSRSAKALGLQMWHTSRLLHNLPGHIRTIIQKIESGSITVTFKHQNLEGLVSTLDRASNRLAVSVILGGTVVGSSIALHAQVLAISGVSAVGIAGYLVAAMLGLWLVWDILRSGRY